VAVEQIIVSQVIDLTGSNVIVQGASFFLEFDVKVAGGGIADLTGGTLACEFRNDYSTAGGATTNCPVATCYLSNAALGKVFLYIASTQTKATYPFTKIIAGRWDAEVLMTSGLKYRIAEGAWAVDNLQVGLKP
jgi:hypothetical protein